MSLKETALTFSSKSLKLKQYLGISYLKLHLSSSIWQKLGNSKHNGLHMHISKSFHVGNQKTRWFSLSVGVCLWACGWVGGHEFILSEIELLGETIFILFFLPVTLYESRPEKDGECNPFNSAKKQRTITGYCMCYSLLGMCICVCSSQQFPAQTCSVQLQYNTQPSVVIS